MFYRERIEMDLKNENPQKNIFRFQIRETRINYNIK